MPVIQTMGHFNYIECDALNCNRKIEHRDSEDLIKLAGLSGWRKVNARTKVSHWLCPKCGSSHIGRKIKSPSRRQRSLKRANQKRG